MSVNSEFTDFVILFLKSRMVVILCLAIVEFSMQKTTPYLPYLFTLDVNECFPDQMSDDYLHLAHTCHTDANCTNTKGSFYYTSLNGYSGNGVNCVGK